MLKPNINLENKKILITGAAGFIGANLTMKLIKEIDNVEIVGFDNLNDYYDVSIKEYRLSKVEKSLTNTTAKWTFVKGNLTNKDLLEELFNKYHFDVVVNLAAQAGVRYSI